MEERSIPILRPSKRGGRPRKSITTNVPIFELICGNDEAEKTWMVGKLVDMQARNDSMEVSDLRRCRRHIV